MCFAGLQFPRLMQTPGASLCLITILLSLGCTENNPESKAAAVKTSAPKQHIRFEIDKSLPDSVVYQNGESTGLFSILESLGGGVSVIDSDADGQPDLFFPGGGTLSATEVKGVLSTLLRQRAAGFNNTSEVAGINTALRYSHGCSSCDYNNDGFADILITGFGGLTLLQNQSDGTFTDVTEESGLNDPHWSSSAGWGDLNNDGSPDLYVAHYVNWSLDNNPVCMGPGNRQDVCPPRAFDGVTDAVFISRSDGTFENSLTALPLAPEGKGLGVLVADLNDDGITDVYVANDTTNNFLYRSSKDNSFEEAGLISGVALDDVANPNGSMGVEVSDIDNDGLPDIWVTNYEDEVIAMYHNSGDANFVHESAARGLNAVGQVFVGFGCAAEDWDLDGDEDFMVSNGHVVRYPGNAPVDQQALLLENTDGRFQRITSDTGAYFSESWSGRGLAVADLNQDGLQDVVVSHIRHPAKLLINHSSPRGKSLRIRLCGSSSRVNRDALGARITVRTAGWPTQHRWISGGNSYLSSSEKTQVFSLPFEADSAEIEVQWPGGNRNSVKLSFPADSERSSLLLFEQKPGNMGSSDPQSLRCVRIQS